MKPQLCQCGFHSDLYQHHGYTDDITRLLQVLGKPESIDFFRELGVTWQMGGFRVSSDSDIVADENVIHNPDQALASVTDFLLELGSNEQNRHIAELLGFYNVREILDVLDSCQNI